MENKLAFVFPGQGSQYVGMNEPIQRFAEGAEVLETADRVLGMSLSRLMAEGPASELNRTVNTQPAIFTVSVAWLRILEAKGISPSVTAGHSLGEYAAMVCAGVLDFSDALQLVQLRGRRMEEAVPEGFGTMMAILGLSPTEVDEICAEVGLEGVVAANYNCPGQVVISGEAALVEKAALLAREKGARRTVPLTVSGPFHSPFMQSVGDELAAVLERLTVRDPKIPVVVNHTANVISSKAEAIDAMVKGVSSPVRWQETVEKLLRMGIDCFVEVGPGKVLSGLIRKTDRQAIVTSVEDPETLEKLLELQKGDVVI